MNFPKQGQNFFYTVQENQNKFSVKDRNSRFLYSIEISRHPDDFSYCLKICVTFFAPVGFVLDFPTSKKAFHHSAFKNFPNFMRNSKQGCIKDHHKGHPLVED